MSELTESLTLIKEIEETFSWRKHPTCFTDSNELSDDEIESVQFLSTLDWKDTSIDIWEIFFDVISWFSPTAFCYYLPGIMTSTIKENEPNIIVVTNIIYMLDRSPMPELWDDYFVQRWTLLTAKECAVVQKWIFWLSSSSIDSDSLMRALETIDLLINMSKKAS